MAGREGLIESMRDDREEVEMNAGVFGALTITFESAAQKKAWLATPLVAGQATLDAAKLACEDSDLFGSAFTVKAKSLKAALEALTDMGFEIEKRHVDAWEKTTLEGAPAIGLRTKGELTAKTDAKAWLAFLEKAAKRGDTFFGVTNAAKRVTVLAYFGGYDEYTHAHEGFMLALATATDAGAQGTLAFVGDAGMLDEAVYQGVRRVDGALVGTRYEEPQDLTEALYDALLKDHDLDPEAISAGRAAWLDTHAEKKVLLERGGKAALIRADGTFMVEPRYIGLGSPREGRISFRPDGALWGYLDEGGAVAVEPAFLSASDFHEGLARVRVETERVVVSEYSARVSMKYGFIDPSGSWAIPAVHDQVENFAGGRAMVTVGGKVGFLDPRGELAVPAVYDFAMAFVDGFALVCEGNRYDGGKWGFVGPDGDALVAPRFRSAGAFYQGFAPFLDDSGTWGLLDTKGAVALSPRFREAAFVQEERILTRGEGGYGMFDMQGEVVLPATFRRITPRGTVYDALCEDGRFELYGRDGARLGELRLAELGDLGDGRLTARAEPGGPWGYVDMDGQWALAPRYAQAYPFGDGRAIVVDEGGVAVIDSEGSVIGRPENGYIGSATAFYPCGFAVLARHGSHALVDRSGALVIPFHLSSTYLKYPGAAWVEYARPDR